MNYLTQKMFFGVKHGEWEFQCKETEWNSLEDALSYKKHEEQAETVVSVRVYVQLEDL